MNIMNMPGFTAESALSNGGRRFRLARPSGGERIEGVSDVRAALINSGGGLSYSCDTDAGTCSCLGGSLSSDCWLLGQYCTTRFECSNYPPYKCTCSYLRAAPKQAGFFRSSLGSVFSR
jgi:hypothetical protein